MSTRILALFALLIPAAASSNDFCKYPDTSRLSGDVGFSNAVREFFGNQKATFYSRNLDIATQALEGLGGPPRDLETVEPGLVMAAACRAHSCDEKSATIIACPSTIVATAIMHFNCGHPEKSCDTTPTVTIFFSNPNKRQRGRAALEDWGRRMGKESGKTVTFLYRTQSNSPIEPLSLK